ncbi:hypothetical protein DL96DRAFT_1564055 [Flagelloscypha sp. PMI_526]|nr:hypothetical protein DL96DRAFT_1564055 [Flagelloscypha sp. PMI_526]
MPVDLPPEIWVQILAFLPHPSLELAKRVNHLFSEICRDLLFRLLELDPLFTGTTAEKPLEGLKKQLKRARSYPQLIKKLHIFPIAYIPHNPTLPEPQAKPTDFLKRLFQKRTDGLNAAESRYTTDKAREVALELASLLPYLTSLSEMRVRGNLHGSPLLREVYYYSNSSDHGDNALSYPFIAPTHHHLKVFKWTTTSPDEYLPVSATLIPFFVAHTTQFQVVHLNPAPSLEAIRRLAIVQLVELRVDLGGRDDGAEFFSLLAGAEQLTTLELTGFYVHSSRDTNRSRGLSQQFRCSTLNSSLVEWKLSDFGILFRHYRGETCIGIFDLRERSTIRSFYGTGSLNLWEGMESAIGEDWGDSIRLNLAPPFGAIHCLPFYNLSGSCLRLVLILLLSLPAAELCQYPARTAFPTWLLLVMMLAPGFQFRVLEGRKRGQLLAGPLVLGFLIANEVNNIQSRL